MLDYFLCVVTIVLFVYYFFRPVPKQKCDVPGLESKDKIQGNFPEMKEAGTFHFFVRDLHNKYGPIARFWWGPTEVVSLGSPALFKQTSKYFNRPPELFTCFEHLVGKQSIQMTNGTEAHRRHQAYGKAMAPDTMKQYYGCFNELAKEFVDRWKELPENEPIALREPCFDFAIKAVLRGMMGDAFNDEEKVNIVRRSYRVLWAETERRLIGKPSEPRSSVMREYCKQQDIVNEILAEVHETRKQNLPGAEEYLPIDAIIELDLDKATVQSDLMTLLVGGYHNTALAALWALYFLARHGDIQEKAQAEVDCVLGKEDVDPDNFQQLIYLRQILYETLRITVGGFAARYSDEDTVIGGYRIPARMPIIQCLSLVFHDPVLYPNPEKFDPERFNSENSKKRPSFAFEPFGFAGKRKCVGYRFAQTKAMVLLAHVVRQFNLTSVGDQDAEIPYTAAPNPKEEIFVTVTPRVH